MALKGSGPRRRSTRRASTGSAKFADRSGGTNRRIAAWYDGGSRQILPCFANHDQSDHRSFSSLQRLQRPSLGAPRPMSGESMLPEASPESSLSAADAIPREELPSLLRQQSLLGEFGRTALQPRDFEQILRRATELCSQGLEARFAKVLEYLPNEKRLLVRAGVGWAPGTVDNISLGADIE